MNRFALWRFSPFGILLPIFFGALSLVSAVVHRNPSDLSVAIWVAVSLYTANQLQLALESRDRWRAAAIYIHDKETTS